MEQKKRVYYYDNIKAFMIILVVIGHFINIPRVTSHLYRSLFCFIYTFHIPVFIFIAGLFHKNERIIQKTLSNILIGMIMKIIIFAFTLGPLRKSTLNLFSGRDATWFMFALAAYEVLAYCVRNIDKRFLLTISIVIGCFAGYDTTIGDFLFLSRIIVFFPFYILGTLVEKGSLMDICSNKRLKALSLFIIFACFSCNYLYKRAYELRYLYTGSNSFSVYSNEIFVEYGGLFRLLCYILAFVVGFSVLCIIPQKELGLLSSLGERTMQVYFWHIIVTYYLKRLIGYTLVSSPAGKIIWILCAIVVSFILGIKVFSFPIKQIRENCLSTQNKQ